MSNMKNSLMLTAIIVYLHIQTGRSPNDNEENINIDDEFKKKLSMVLNQRIEKNDIKSRRKPKPNPKPKLPEREPEPEYANWNEIHNKDKSSSMSQRPEIIQDEPDIASFGGNDEHSEMPQIRGRVPPVPPSINKYQHLLRKKKQPQTRDAGTIYADVLSSDDAIAMEEAKSKYDEPVTYATLETMYDLRKNQKSPETFESDDHNFADYNKFDKSRSMPLLTESVEDETIASIEGNDKNENSAIIQKRRGVPPIPQTIIQNIDLLRKNKKPQTRDARTKYFDVKRRSSIGSTYESKFKYDDPVTYATLETMEDLRKNQKSPIDSYSVYANWRDIQKNDKSRSIDPLSKSFEEGSDIATGGNIKEHATRFETRPKKSIDEYEDDNEKYGTVGEGIFSKPDEEDLLMSHEEFLKKLSEKKGDIGKTISSNEETSIEHEQGQERDSSKTNTGKDTKKKKGVGSKIKNLFQRKNK